jgi:hypothetical protein
MGVVADIIEGAADVVGDVVEFVGDVVEDVVEVVVDVVDYVAENPEVALIAVAAPALLPSIGITGIAVQPVTAGLISASQGGDLEDIGKAALGSFIGQGVGGAVAGEVGSAIGAKGASTPIQTALANTVGGATGSAAGAVATGADVGEAALMGAAGSAGASLARSGAVELGQQPKSFSGELAADIGEAAGRTAVGGDFRQELASSALGALSREGNLALEELKNRPQTERTKQIIAAFSEPRSPGVGTQLGEATAELGGAIVPGTRADIEEARRLGIEVPESNMKAAVVSDRELPEVTVTGSRIDGSDVRTGRTIPSSLPSGRAKAAGTAGGVTTTATGGMGAGEGGGRAPEEMTGAELLESAAAGEERERLPEVEVEDELIEEPIDFTKFTDEELIELIEYLNQEFPLTEPEAPEPDFQPMDVRPARGSTRRAAPSSISPRVVGTNPTAAIVGEKEPIFGGEEDAQQSVWNTRSLRLRKALGG